MVRELYRIVRLNKLIFTGGACLLAVVMVIGVWLEYDRNVQILKLQEQYSSIRRMKNREGADPADPYVKAKQDIRAFYDRLEPKKAFLVMVGDLKQLLDQSGLSLPRMTFKPEFLKGPSVWKYQTSCTMSGSYPDLKEILAKLQSAEELFCIDQLSLYHDAPSRDKMSMTIEFTTFYKENNGLPNGQK